MRSYILDLDQSVRKQQVDRFRSLFGPRSNESDKLFSDTERLSILEEQEVVSWGDFYALLLTGVLAPTTEAQIQFLECAKGALEPKTVHQWAIIKLLHQALCFGGAYRTENSGFNIYPGHQISSEPNDIEKLKGTKLGKVLQKISERWANYDNSKLDYSKLMEDEEYDREEYERERSLISAGLNLDLNDLAENFSRSDADGWFYDDDDDDS